MHFLLCKVKVKHVIGKEGVRNVVGSVMPLVKKARMSIFGEKKKIKEILIMEEMWPSSPDLIWDGDKKYI